MDPRSPASPRDLEQQLQLGRQIFAETTSGRRALAEVKSVQKQLSDLEQKVGDHADLKTAVSQLETEIRKVLTGSEDPASNAVGLENANAGLASALAAVESGDRAVPSQAIALYHESSEVLKQRMTDWNHIKRNWLPQLNQHLRQNNIAPIETSEIAEDVKPG
jgi:hypothetical protein